MWDVETGEELLSLQSKGDNWIAGVDFSPDGTRIAYEQGGDLWVMNADGSGKIRLTSSFWSDGIPRWRPVL